jgi:hypothetical protein
MSREWFFRVSFIFDERRARMVNRWFLRVREPSALRCSA